MRTAARNVPAAKSYSAAIRPSFALQQRDQRRFSRTIRPNQGVRLVLKNIERYIVRGGHTAITFYQTTGGQQYVIHAAAPAPRTTAGLHLQVLFFDPPRQR